MTGYYDVILGLIPLALGGITALLFAVGYPIHHAVVAGGSVSIGLMGHALFVRAPVAPSTEPVSDQAQHPPARDTRFNSAD